MCIIVYCGSAVTRWTVFTITLKLCQIKVGETFSDIFWPFRGRTKKQTTIISVSQLKTNYFTLTILDLCVSTT